LPQPLPIPQQIAGLHAQHEQLQSASDFISLSRALLASGGDLAGARGFINKMPRLSSRARGILTAPEAGHIFQRAAVSGQVLAGSVFADYKATAAGFLTSLANVGVFDRLLANGMRRLPLETLTTGAVSISAVGAVVSEQSAKPISRLTITSSTTTVRKAVAAVIVSNELARVTEDVNSLIGQELRNACVAAIDSQFLSIATSGVSGVNSVGSSAAAFRADLGNALNSITVDQTSRLFIIMTSANAKALAALGDAAGSANSAFPDMTPRGGVISGIEVIVSDSLSANQWILVDASAFAAASGDLILSPFRHTSIQMESSPDSPATSATNLLNLWQLNLTALVCERFFICERLRTSSVAVVQNAQYAFGFSP
jgi:hypothetical protein